MKFDVVVIGSGSAGGVLAARLSEDSRRRVLLLEAGPDTLTFAGPSTLWGFTSVDGGFLPRGKIIGGCSATNAAIALRGTIADYGAWGPGWTFQEVLPYFLKTEKDLDFGTESSHSNTGPVTIRRTASANLTELSRAFIETVVSLGHKQIDDHNRPGAVGVGPAPMNELGGIHQSTAVTYLAEARTRRNLTIRCHALVENLLIARGQIAGVRLADEVIEADAVILCAGAYGSPSILLRSGIGPAEDLAALGIVSVADLPVGRGLQDHALVPINLSVLDGLMQARFETILSFASSASELPDLQLFVGGPPNAGPVAPPPGTFIVGAALMKPQSRGRLWLRSADPAESPNIDLGLLSDPADPPRLLEAVLELYRIIETEPFASLIVRPPPAADLLASVGTYHHPTGTCAMGEVVDSRCAVKGIDGLWVVDASVMPEIPAANTNIPTMMMAERVLPWLLETL
ncbi:MAG TPA: dehydrogenase [Micromonosporaceae bacterium]|nr:dehydrogenase [Micromonosporaceae bacterium]